MKNTIPFKLLLSFVFMFSVLNTDLNAQNRKADNSNVDIFGIKIMDGNNIGAVYYNDGRFDYRYYTGPFKYVRGLEWPLGSSKSLTYAAGIWLAGKVNNDTLVAISSYEPEYFPGYININGNPEGKNDSAFRIYKITRGDTLSKDYLNWPVSQGAYLDINNKPFLPGTQTMFYCMTDGYPESHINSMGSTAPLKAQVQVTNWCYNIASDEVLSNTIFMEIKVINKNSLSWNDAIISAWADECDIENVAIGCDTILNIGYAYCRPEFSQYTIPPAFGFIILQGPIKYTGNPNDTVYSFIPGKNQRRIRVGYKELDFSSFNMMQNNHQVYHDPRNFKESYLTMQGFKPTGENWFDTITNSVTKFPFSGDPESGMGWNQFTSSGYGNRRLLMNFGFLNISPGDTQTIVIAQVVSQGISNLNSVTKLKQDCQYIKNVFNQSFTTVRINNLSEINNTLNYNLSQNYPNPFNPSTVIRYTIPSNARLTNGQVKGQTSNVKLIIYDVLGNEVATLVNENQNSGSYSVTFDGANLSSGIYFYKLETDNSSEVKKMTLLK